MHEDLTPLEQQQGEIDDRRVSALFRNLGVYACSAACMVGSGVMFTEALQRHDNLLGWGALLLLAGGSYILQDRMYGLVKKIENLEYQVAGIPRPEDQIFEEDKEDNPGQE